MGWSNCFFFCRASPPCLHSFCYPLLSTDLVPRNHFCPFQVQTMSWMDARSLTLRLSVPAVLLIPTRYTYFLADGEYFEFVCSTALGSLAIDTRTASRKRHRRPGRGNAASWISCVLLSTSLSKLMNITTAG